MDILKLCLEKNVSKAAKIPVEKLTFMPELRQMCEQNACGRFGQNYCCPPHVGDVEALIAKLKAFDEAVIWQNIYPLEDSFDFEGMMDAQKKHNDMTLEMARTIYEELGRDQALVLAAGGCGICNSCAVITKEPCRNPADALSSLEAYGIHVAKIGEVSELRYINGKDTVTYFSGAFVVNYKGGVHE